MKLVDKFPGLVVQEFNKGIEESRVVEGVILEAELSITSSRINYKSQKVSQAVKMVVLCDEDEKQETIILDLSRDNSAKALSRLSETALSKAKYISKHLKMNNIDLVIAPTKLSSVLKMTQIKVKL